MTLIWSVGVCWSGRRVGEPHCRKGSRASCLFIYNKRDKTAASVLKWRWSLQTLLIPSLSSFFYLSFPSFYFYFFIPGTSCLSTIILVWVASYPLYLSFYSWSLFIMKIIFLISIYVSLYISACERKSARAPSLIWF